MAGATVGIPDPEDALSLARAEVGGLRKDDTTRRRRRRGGIPATRLPAALEAAAKQAPVSAREANLPRTPDRETPPGAALAALPPLSAGGQALSSPPSPGEPAPRKGEQQARRPTGSPRGGVRRKRRRTSGPCRLLAQTSPEAPKEGQAPGPRRASRPSGFRRLPGAPKGAGLPTRGGREGPPGKGTSPKGSVAVPLPGLGVDGALGRPASGCGSSAYLPHLPEQKAEAAAPVLLASLLTTQQPREGSQAPRVPQLASRPPPGMPTRPSTTARLSQGPPKVHRFAPSRPGRRCGLARPELPASGGPRNRTAASGSVCSQLLSWAWGVRRAASAPTGFAPRGSPLQRSKN
ncbi:uncharacterized protein LOC143824006 [Paroedura picta]|uniref:uncharacterized protein LOC143824006 n=1 Tax=Paroedura picta TaxID=143630 RepID=UPI004057A1AB